MLVPIRGQNGRPFNLLLPGRLADFPPELRVELGHAKQSPIPASGVDRHPCRPKARLNGERAGTTHGVEQDLAWLPSGKGQQACGEHLIEWRPRPGCPIAPFEQGILAHQVERNGHVFARNVEVDQLLRSCPVDVEVPAPLALHAVPEMVAHGVLETEHRKLIVREMLAVDRDIEGHGPPVIHPLAPIQLHGPGVQIIRPFGLESKHGAQHPHRKPRRLQEGVQPRFTDVKRDAPASGHNLGGAQGLQFSSDEGLQPHQSSTDIFDWRLTSVA